MFSINLPETVEQKLNQLCHDTNKDKNELIIEAIQNYIEDIEDYKAALEVSLDKNEKYFTSGEVLKYLEDNAKK